MKYFILFLFLLTFNFACGQEKERCEYWYELHSFHINDLKPFQIIQANDKYGFRLVYREVGDSLCGSGYFLLDMRKDSAYYLLYTFADNEFYSYGSQYADSLVKRNIFTPDGKYTALKLFHFDGIPVIRTRDLRAYLQHKTSAEICIDRYEPGKGPAPIHRIAGWKNNTKLIYTWGCCGTLFTEEYDIKKKKSKLLRSEELYGRI